MPDNQTSFFSDITENLYKTDNGLSSICIT